MNEKQSQMMNQSQLLNQVQMLNQPPPQLVMNQPQMMMNQNQPPPLMNQPPPQMMTQNQPQVLMNQPQAAMNRSYGLWAAHQQAQAAKAKAAMDPMKYQTFSAVQSSSSSMPGRSNNWKGKKGTNNRKDGRRNEQQKLKPVANPGMKNVIPGGFGGGGGGGTGGGYKPPTLQELQSQNRLKARKYYQKKKFNNRFAPYAPRNTTSFIIRAKKSGGIASLVSPCPVTPAVLPTPIFSPSREVLGDMAKEEWGVDGYGSMKGLIRLRDEAELHDEDEDEDGGSSESDVEEHVEVERRLDHDLSRFEMIYPNCEVGYNNLLENRVDDQDTHIAQLEEENLTLKERLFLMERELGDLRRRMQCLERQNHEMDDVNEEVVENGSDNESESSEKGNFHAMSGQNNEEVVEHVVGDEGSGADVGAEGNNEEVVESMSGNEEKEVNAEEENNAVAVDVCMEEIVIAPEKEVIAEEDNSKDGEETNARSENSIGDGDLSNCPALV